MEKSKYLSPTLLLIEPDPTEPPIEDPYSQNDHGDIPINGEGLTDES